MKSAVHGNLLLLRKRQADLSPKTNFEDASSTGTEEGHFFCINTLKCKVLFNKKTAIPRIRAAISIFMAGLIFSGLTAIPLREELAWLLKYQAYMPHGLYHWLDKVHEAITFTYTLYPYLAYSNDWLAFGHVMLAVAFIGAWEDPLRNSWLIRFGLIACASVIPVAFLMGALHQIPIWWRLIDCSFGLFGAIPLAYAFYWIKRLSPYQSKNI